MTLHKAWVVARNELYMSLRSPQSLVYFVVVPALVIYLSGLAAHEVARQFTPVVRVDWLDLDQSPASRALATAVAEANPAFVLCPSDGESPDDCGLAGAPLSAELAETRLANETTSATIVVPPGFGAALATGQRVSIEFRAGAAAIAPDMVTWALRSAATDMAAPAMAAKLSGDMLQSLGVAVDASPAERLAEARTAWQAGEPVRVVTEVSGANDKLALATQVLSNGFVVSTPSVTAMFVMISVLGLAQALAEERLLGVLRRLGTMPLHRWEWLLGKLAANGVLGLLQVGALLVFGAALGVSFGAAPCGVLLVSAAYVLAVAALAVVLAAAARTTQQASAYATVAWLVLVPLGGGWWPLAFVPSWLRTIGHVSPVAWYLDALNAIVSGTATPAGVAVSTGMLLLFAGLCLGIGVLRLESRASAPETGPAQPYFGAGGDRVA